MLTNIAVFYVKAVNNDKGFNGTENGNCNTPVTVAAASTSTASRTRRCSSVVDGNADGILLTDDYAPTAHNLIERGQRQHDRMRHRACGPRLERISFVQNADGTMTVTGRNPTVGA